ncbi:MAG: hypothetical protein GX803_10115 [Lentisphaerae bacterium]|jgi:hypothetical protein|nr:hypothetical protein [Lentisphaerota bacterium]
MMREFKAAKEQDVDAASAKSGFPAMTPSASADKSFARELERVQNLSIEARILEALTMQQRFDWLNPVLCDGES